MNYAEMAELPSIIKDFLFYTETVKGKSATTVSEYFLDLRTFFRFIKRHYGLVPSSLIESEISIQDVNIELIKRITLADGYAFMAYCKTERENEASTRARKTSSLRSYFNYLQKKASIISINPFDELDIPKLKKSLPKYLTLDESLKLLDCIDGKYKTRNYLIITLFLNCGMRLSELCGLNLSDIRDDKTIKLTGKGNKERIIYLNEACETALNAYLKDRPNEGVKDKNALFISRQMNRISNKTVQMIVYTFLEKSGLGGQGYSVHKLRHTAATLMYQHGKVDIRVLKDILGHENLGTTEIYTHLSNTQIEDALSANPLAYKK